MMYSLVMLSGEDPAVSARLRLPRSQWCAACVADIPNPIINLRYCRPASVKIGSSMGSPLGCLRKQPS